MSHQANFKPLKTLLPPWHYTESRVQVRSVSFKGSLQALRNWAPHLNQAKISKAERLRLICDLNKAMIDTPIRHRPGRSEPPCRKRRPKTYQLMTAPRSEMKEISHRNKYRAEIALTSAIQDTFLFLSHHPQPILNTPAITEGSPFLIGRDYSIPLNVPLPADFDSGRQ